MKKTLLGLGTLATIATPVAAIVSCTFERGEDIRIQNKNFEDINNLSDAVDQASRMEELSTEIKDANKVGLLAGKEICKTELNERDNLVRFTYKDVPLEVDESEDDSEGILEGEYPLVRITIQATDDPKIIRIERLSKDEESTKDVTSKEKKYFDEAKVTETIDKIKESIEETEKVRQIDATKVINVEESSLIGNNIITPASRIEDNSIILPSRIEDNSIALIGNNAISQASVIEDNSITRIDGSNLTSGIQVLDPERRMEPLQIKKRPLDYTCKTVQLDDATLKLAQDIRAEMNSNDDIRWHTYGDSLLDGVNAVRLAIHNDLNGDPSLKHKLRDFIDGGLHWFRIPKLPEDNNYYWKYEKAQINDWLDDKIPLNILTQDGWDPLAAAVKANDGKGDKAAADLVSDSKDPKIREVLDKNYGPLTLGTSEFRTTEHRAQELDWLNNFDGHGHGATMNKIKAKVTENNGHPTGEFSKIPIGDEGQGAENYVFTYTYNEHKFEEGIDFTGGLLSAIDVFYDLADGAKETSHRSHCFSKFLTTYGWSFHASSYNTNAFNYTITRVGQEGIAFPSDKLDQIKRNNPYLNKYSLDMLKYGTPFNYLNRNSVFGKNAPDHWGLPGAYGGYYADDVAEIFCKPHSSVDELIADILTLHSFSKDFVFKQPTKEIEVDRFARPQKVGRPDVFVKSYDYNGGGTQTGYECGYSILDPTLF